MLSYLRDPDEIYRRSFAAVREATDLSRLQEALRPLAIRLVHASGSPEIVTDLAASADAVNAGRKALATGAPVLVDAGMVAAGIIRARLPKANEVICTLDTPGIAEMAKLQGTTRSAAAISLWRSRLGGAVVAIGNAPTALFRLLEILAEGAPKPALILGFPVGFIGAAESKEALIEHAGSVPYITLRGRRGGSAIAAAAVNALCGDAP
jgi:precorrin-8X/cobalt-precorrin-8 methylmutase